MGVEFLDYSINLTPPNSRMTLFIRAWNKWADPVEAQYTLDTLSIVGEKPDDPLFDQPLPATGGQTGLPTDLRVWGGLILLIALVASAVSRVRRTHALIRNLKITSLQKEPVSIPRLFFCTHFPIPFL